MCTALPLKHLTLKPHYLQLVKGSVLRALAVGWFSCFVCVCHIERILGTSGEMVETKEGSIHARKWAELFCYAIGVRVQVCVCEVSPGGHGAGFGLCCWSLLCTLASASCTQNGVWFGRGGFSVFLPHVSFRPLSVPECQLLCTCSGPSHPRMLIPAGSGRGGGIVFLVQIQCEAAHAPVSGVHFLSGSALSQ